MTKTALAFMSALALLMPSTASAVEPLSDDAIYGTWIRGGRIEKLEFFDCSGKLCARGVNPSSKDLLILRYATKIEPHQWKGDLFNPENGKIYNATIRLDDADQLTLTGCLIAFLCQSETWRKIPDDSPSRKSPILRRRGTNP